MNTLQEAQREMKLAEAQTDYTPALTISLQMAQAYAAIAQAEALAAIAMQLGNIHQALLTPNAEREPITIADILHGIHEAIEERNNMIVSGEGR